MKIRACGQYAAIVATLLVVTLCSPPSRAELVPMDIPTLADQCEHAVTGRVLAVNSFWNETQTKIYTEIQIELSEDLKGNINVPAVVLTLTELGGTIGDTTMVVQHAPSFVVGEQVLVFTEYASDGRLIVLGRTQGKITLANSRDPQVRSAPRGVIAYTPQGRQTLARVRQLMLDGGHTPTLLDPNGMTPRAPGTGPASPINGLTLGQRSIADERWNETGVFAEQRPDQELLEYRTRVSKTFANPDGTRTAYLIGPVHYLDQTGAWQDICYDVAANDSDEHPDYGYANLTNDFISYFPARYGEAGVVTGRPASGMINLWRKPRVQVITADGEVATALTPSAVDGRTSGRSVMFRETYPGMSDEYTVLDGGLEHYVHIESTKALGSVRDGKLVFTDSIPLPEGCTVLLNGQAQTEDFTADRFTIVAADGETFLLQPIVAFDGRFDRQHLDAICAPRIDVPPAKRAAAEEEIRRLMETCPDSYLTTPYTVRFRAGVLDVSYALDIGWLRQRERQFPIVVDPQVLIGSNGGQWGPIADCVYNTTYHDSRCQWVLLASDLTGAGLVGAPIHAYAIACYTTPASVLVNLRWRFQNTSDTTSTAWLTSGFTQNWGPSSYQPTGNHWTNYSGMSGFSWDGSSNLMVDFSRDDIDYVSCPGSWYKWNAGSNRMCGGHSDSGYAWPFDGMTATAYDHVPWTQITTGYCTGGSSVCDEYISRVQVGSIDWSSTCGTGGYQDWTAHSTSMTVGGSYGITVTNGNPYASDECGIWVDWNQDEDFSDAGETITVSGTPGGGPYTATITPPAGTPPGSTRMRIRITYDETPAACGISTRGEVEDYTVVNGAVSSITSISPNHAPAGVGSAGPTGSLVTITGTDFGSSQSASDHVVFWSNGSNYYYDDTYIVSWSDTQIQCYVPAASSSKDCAVYKAGIWSNFYPFTVDWSFWYRWQDETVMPLPFLINQNGSDDFIAGEEFTATRAGLATWEAVEECYAFYEDLGTTTLTATNRDYHNVISWTESGWSYGSGVIGVTTIWLISGIIVETDAEYNGQNYTFCVGSVAGQVDVQNVVTHETGHGYIGLADLYGVPDQDKTMYGYLNVGGGETKKRSLTSDDEDGAQWIYPYTEHCYTCPTYDFGTFVPTETYATHGPIAMDSDGCRWYRFDLESYTQYRFTVCEGGGYFSGNTVFELWNSTCTAMVASDDDSCGQGSQIDYVPTLSSVYNLKVRPYYPSPEPIKYKLAYRYVPGTCNTPPNHDFAITPTTTYQTHSSEVYRGGCRLYEVTMDGGKPYRFTFCEGGGAANYDTYLILYDSAGTELAHNDDVCGVRSELDYECTTGGTYYLEVNSSGDDYGGTYTLAYRCGECLLDGDCSDGDPCTDDLCLGTGIDRTCDFVPNNPDDPTNADASPPEICDGESTTLSASVSGAEIDWYTGSCGGTYVDTGNSISVSPSTTTTYYARARHASTGCESPGCDSATATVNPLPPTPTNGQADPPAVCTGGSSDLSASVGASETIDWYTGSCGGTFVDTGNPLTVYPVADTTYYGVARDTVTGCESVSCVVVSVSIIPDPTPPTSATVDRDWFCPADTGMIALEAFGGSGDDVRWFEGSCGGSDLGTGNPLSIASPASTTTYYARWENPCGDTSCTWVVVHVDADPPTFTYIPDDVDVYADAGTCEAAGVDIGQAIAVDAHNEPVNVVATRSDAAELSSPYPEGITTITWTATDACLNETTDNTQTVTVFDKNLLNLDVGLLGINSGSFDRCITFDLVKYDCSVVTMEDELTFTNGEAIGAVFEVPCGDYWCILAEDELHTLARRLDRDAGLNIASREYVAALTLSNALVSGDLFDDNFVDIVDFGVYITGWGNTYGTVTCDTNPPHADISGDDAVDVQDFSFVSTYFLYIGDSSCCGTLGNGRQPRESITVAELALLGLDDLAAADLNNDGVLDLIDVQIFLDGGVPDPKAELSEEERPATNERRRR